MKEEPLSAEFKRKNGKADFTISVESDYLLIAEKNDEICFVLSEKEAKEAGIKIDWPQRRLLDTEDVVLLTIGNYLIEKQRKLPQHFQKKYFELMVTFREKIN